MKSFSFSSSMSPSSPLTNRKIKPQIHNWKEPSSSSSRTEEEEKYHDNNKDNNRKATTCRQVCHCFKYSQRSWYLSKRIFQLEKNGDSRSVIVILMFLVFVMSSTLYLFPTFSSKNSDDQSIQQQQQQQLQLHNNDNDWRVLKRQEQADMLRRIEREQEYNFHHFAGKYNHTFADYDYNAPAIPNEWTLPNPKVYSFDNDNPNGRTKRRRRILVLVLSSRDHWKQRQVIRQTWGKDQALYFVIGGTSSSANSTTTTTTTVIGDNQNKQLQKEQETYQDLLDTIHPDSYPSLPYKLKYAFHWIHKMYYSNHNTSNQSPNRQSSTSASSAPPPNWVLKVDDDMYPRINALYDSLLLPFGEHYSSSSSSGGGNDTDLPKIWLGHFQLDAPVYREGKWAEKRYPHNTYPIFAIGSCGYIVNRGIIQYVAEQYQHDSQQQQQQNSKQQQQQQQNSKQQNIALQLYQGEDTSLGIWLEAMQEQELAKEESTYYIDSPYFVNHANCSDMDALCVGHGLNANDIQTCHEIEKLHNEQQKKRSRHVLYYLETVTQRIQNLLRDQKNHRIHNDGSAAAASRTKLKEAENNRLEKATKREQLRRQKVVKQKMHKE